MILTKEGESICEKLASWIGVGAPMLQGNPSLRTGHADLPHPALQSIRTLYRDWHATRWAFPKEKSPIFAK